MCLKYNANRYSDPLHIITIAETNKYVIHLMFRSKINSFVHFPRQKFSVFDARRTFSAFDALFSRAPVQHGDDHMTTNQPMTSRAKSRPRIPVISKQYVLSL